MIGNRVKKSKVENGYFIFDQYQSDKNKDKKFVDEMYVYIENIYLKKIKKKAKDKKLEFIERERTRVEKSLGMHRGISKEIGDINKAVLLIIMTSVINGMLKFLEGLKIEWLSYTDIYTMFFIGNFIIILPILISVYKSNDSDKDTINNISLKVLDKLEKEINLN